MGGLYFFGLLHIFGFALGGPVDNELAYIKDIRSAPAPGQRIVTGWEAENGQFPFTVSLRNVGSTGGVSACTASLLSNQWILTAAHCLARRYTFVVRVGQNDISRPGYMVEATERYIHENYDEQSDAVQTEDIGLLKLNHFIPYREFIQPIRIQSSQRKHVEYPNVQLTVNGYGRTDDWWAGGVMHDLLYWTYQRGITQQECRVWYPNSQAISVQTVCSQYYNHTSQNPCTGDSGGPLTLVDVDGKLTQIGIMSFGASRGCNTPNPSGFVRPDYYHDWIEKQTGISFDWDAEELESKHEKATFIN